MTQDVAKKDAVWQWSEPKLEAARLTAEGKLIDEVIASKVRISRRTLLRWKDRPEFMAKVAELLKTIESAVLRRGIAARYNRVRALDDRWQRMQMIIDERAADPDMLGVPGGKSGLIVRQLSRLMKRTVPGTPAAPGVPAVAAHEEEVPVWEYAVDTGLLKEMREHERQAAQELGQWVDKVAPTSPDGESPYVSLNDAATAQALAALYARLGAATGGAAADGEDNPAGSLLGGTGTSDEGRGANAGSVAGNLPWLSGDAETAALFPPGR